MIINLIQEILQFLSKIQIKRKKSKERKNRRKTKGKRTIYLKVKIDN